MSAKWRKGSEFTGDAQEAADCLEELRKDNEGKLETEAIIDAARPKKHALHRHFQWDDAVAAEEHRKTTARSLVRSIVVIVGDSNSEREAPAYIHVATGQRGKGYYQNFSVATFDEFKSALDGLRGRLGALANSVAQLEVVARDTKQRKVAVKVRKTTDKFTTEMAQIL